MGIHDLSKVISDHAPDAVSEHEMKNYFGRKIAIDASMSLYQFLISIRQAGGAGVLTDSAGEATSHIIGMFYRTIRMMTNGIKPVFVFDGKPPELKSAELAKRSQRAEEAREEQRSKDEAEREHRWAKQRELRVHDWRAFQKQQQQRQQGQPAAKRARTGMAQPTKAAPVVREKRQPGQEPNPGRRCF